MNVRKINIWTALEYGKSTVVLYTTQALEASMIVMKFGGTSVCDERAFGRLVEAVRRASMNRPLAVVVSALSGVTNQLLEVASAYEEGARSSAVEILSAILKRHVAIASALGDANVVKDIRGEFLRISELVGPLGIHPSSLRLVDEIIAVGELVSSRLVAAILRHFGIPAVWVDAREVMLTDSFHGQANPNLEGTRERVKRLVAPILALGEVPVIGGYIGADANGVTTTLGRDGSDFSAAILAVCLQAREMQKLTRDVDGVLSDEGEVLSYLPYAEALRLAAPDGQSPILHPSAVKLATAWGLQIRVRSSCNLDHPGTLITY